MFLEDEISRINDKLKQLENINRVIVWGAGEHTVKLFQYAAIMDYAIDFFADNRLKGRLFGIDIKKPDEIHWEDVQAVVISSFYRENEIVEALHKIKSFAGKVITLYENGATTPFYYHISQSDLRVPDVYKDLIDKNKQFKNIHRGERLFILCNGPSINQMDLTKLKDEHVMAVSNFYLHKDYDTINPEYYCIPQFTYTNFFTEELAIDWLTDIGKNVKNTTFFFSITEKELIYNNQLLTSNHINYLCQGITTPFYEDIDLTKRLLNWQSVSIMCLQVAMYMGFKEIYLIGTEHSELTTGKYEYFYERKKSVVGNADFSVDSNGKNLVPFRKTLRNLNSLWNQYELLKKIAEKDNIDIYNATIGGDLDVFERVQYKTII